MSVALVLRPWLTCLFCKIIVGFLGFSTLKIILFVCKNGFIFCSKLCTFPSFSCLPVRPGSGVVKDGTLSLPLEVFCPSLLVTVLTVHLLYASCISLFYSCFAKIFYHERMMNFVKCFFFIFGDDCFIEVFFGLTCLFVFNVKPMLLSWDKLHLVMIFVIFFLLVH